MSAKKYLVIVESPEKSKNIHGFLGSNYKVIATKGHVRDLPKSELGIDIENDFEPKKRITVCHSGCSRSSYDKYR